MGAIDVSVKHSFALRPQDWARFLGVPEQARVKAVDSDVSSVATITDKVFEVDGSISLLLHLEPMAYYDAALDVRIFEANGRLAKRHQRPVHSCVLALHRRAWGKANQGHYRATSPLGHCRVDFTYQVIKIWELSPDDLLKEGVGLLPLVPLTAVSRPQLRSVINRIATRLRSEVPRAVEADLWCATYVMLGLRFDEIVIETLLSNVRDIMRESVTYRRIIAEGLAEGREQGFTEGHERGLSEGRFETILQIGTKRFGQPPKRVQEKLTAIKDPVQFDALINRLLKVSSWQELLAAKSN